VPIAALLMVIAAPPMWRDLQSLRTGLSRPAA
jgi:hypothetical protein